MRSAKGTIRKRGEGRWWVSKPGPIDPATGKRTEIGRAVRGSRVDAAVALAELIGEGLPDETTWEAFWNGVVQPSFDGLALKTVHEYERLWNVELRHRIGKERVADMDWHRANEVLTEISAPTVQRSAGRLLKKMCSTAPSSALRVRSPGIRQKCGIYCCTVPYNLPRARIAAGPPAETSPAASTWDATP